MKDKTCLIYGAGRGGLTVLESMVDSPCRVIGFVDDEKTGLVGSLPIYNIHDMPDVDGIIIAVADGHRRLELFERHGSVSINAIHPRAIVSSTTIIGTGNHIKAGAVVDAGVQIGNCCIIDNGAIVAHDCVLEDAVHLAPGCVLGSSIIVRKYTIVGIGACIATGAKIGQNCIILPGSSVVADIPDNSVVEGVPGRIVGKRK